jgi:kynurenine formamidase
MPDEVLDLLKSLSNWGRWGDADEIGTLNFITPDKVVRAARLITSGRRLSIAQDLSTVASRKNRNPILHKMLYRGPHPHGAADVLTIEPHGFHVTHLDALAHMYHDGKVYNGRAVEDVAQQDGLTFGSIHAQRNGITTRGVLLDVAQARGQQWLNPDDMVTAADLSAAEELAGVRVTSGDALIVRIGMALRERQEGQPEDPSARVGLGPDCLPWLYEREVAMFAGDCTDKLPYPHPQMRLPLHVIGMVAMGLVLLDHVAVEELAEACREEHRNEFFFTVAPLRLPRGTGSAVNPLCIF